MRGILIYNPFYANEYQYQIYMEERDEKNISNHHPSSTSG